MDPRAFRPRPHAVLLALIALLWGAAPAEAGGFAGTPFARVAAELLERLHAEAVTCPVDLEADSVCFVVEPGRAAPLAEALESFVLEEAEVLEVGPWRSGNGTHRVTIAFRDDTWGALEVWFAERDATRVDGRLEHLLRRRD